MPEGMGIRRERRERREKREREGQKTEDRRQKTEDRRQKTEDRRQKTEKMLEVNLQPCRAYGPEGGLRQEIGQSQ